MLTPQQIRMARWTATHILPSHFDQGESVRAYQIGQELKRVYFRPVDDRLVRGLMRHIHVTGMMPDLIADRTGYRRAQTPEEIEDYQQRLQRQAAAVASRVGATQRDLKKWRRLSPTTTPKAST